MRDESDLWSLRKVGFGKEDSEVPGQPIVVLRRGKIDGSERSWESFLGSIFAVEHMCFGPHSLGVVQVMC